MAIKVGDFVDTGTPGKGRVVAINGDWATVYHANGLGEAQHSMASLRKIEKKAKR